MDIRDLDLSTQLNGVMDAGGMPLYTTDVAIPVQKRGGGGRKSVILHGLGVCARWHVPDCAGDVDNGCYDDNPCSASTAL